MASSRGDYIMNPEEVQAGVTPPRKERGCFFYGCIIASVLAVLTAIVIGIIAYLAYRTYYRYINEYTSTTPTPLPKVAMPDEQRKAVRERFDAFKEALDKGEDAEPLVLDSDELNVLLAEESQAKDRVHVMIEGDKLNGQVSLPLDQVGLPGTKGRFFNGKATFRASLQGGVLVVTADSAEVNGRPLPEQFIAGIRNKNLAEDVARNPENAAFLNKLESLQVKDGKVIVKAKPKEERTPQEPKDAGKAEEPPGEQPAPKAGDESPPATKDEAKEPPAEKEKD